VREEYSESHLWDYYAESIRSVLLQGRSRAWLRGTAARVLRVRVRAVRSGVRRGLAARRGGLVEAPRADVGEID
jgi:hypothetical protein